MSGFGAVPGLQGVGMYVAVIPNRGSPPAILLRESYREGRKVRTRTLANLSHWPPAQIETLRRVLRGETLVAPEEAFEIVRSLPHGHVAAVVGTMRRLGLDQLIASRPSRQRSLVLGMIAARLIAPASKLATARGFDPRTQHSTLGEVLGLGAASADDLYEAMDWLVARQGRVEAALARRHLQEGPWSFTTSPRWSTRGRRVRWSSGAIPGTGDGASPSSSSVW